MEKVCSRCQKPFDTEGYKTCPSCREYKRRWRKANLEANLEYHRTYMREKWCPTHREECRERQRQWAKANPEKYQESSQKWRESNREKHREATRKWRVANIEHVRECGRESSRKYRLEHPGTSSVRMRAWRTKNPDKARALRHNYKARKRGNGGTYTGEELTALFEKQGGKCFYCGGLIYSSFDKELHVDHKVPLIRGGTNDITNIALACSRCNLSKNTKTAEEFLGEVWGIS